MAFDIIGDIHGHADALEALLKKLGYQEGRSGWKHASRTAIFVGDFIDRGPRQLDVLNMVRRMIDSGNALAVMGNHEFNAIGWATRDPTNEDLHLRTRLGKTGAKNRHQHQKFLSEVGEDTPEHFAWVDWFCELPIWIERPGFRVAHACWDDGSADTLRPELRSGNRLSRSLVETAHLKQSASHQAVEILLKGPEVSLPNGLTFRDADGNLRSDIRFKWWDRNVRTYAEAYVGPAGSVIPCDPLPADFNMRFEPDRPTFIGHYWLDPDASPAPLAPKVACLDYSVARGGHVAAYRFDGEDTLLAENFVRS